MADAFDELMNNTCTILQRKPNASDRYNQPSTNWVLKEANVPCRVSLLPKSIKREVDIQAAIMWKMVYMRPHNVDEHDALQLADGTFYEVMDVNNPSLADHHLELTVKEIKA